MDNPAGRILRRALLWAIWALLAVPAGALAQDGGGLKIQVYTFRIGSAGLGARTVIWVLDGRVLGRTASREMHWPLTRGAHTLLATVRLSGRHHATRLGPVRFQVE